MEISLNGKVLYFCMLAPSLKKCIAPGLLLQKLQYMVTSQVTVMFPFKQYVAVAQDCEHLHWKVINIANTRFSLNDHNLLIYYLILII